MAARKRKVIGPAAPRIKRRETSASSKRTAVPSYKPERKRPNAEVSSYNVADTAESREFFRGFPTSTYQEPDVKNLKESERFSWESNTDAKTNVPDGFIPLTYAPTKTSWPANGWDHRRTVAAGYNRANGTLRVKFFTDGAVYDYGVETPVPPYVAYQFRSYFSPGIFIRTTLETYGYTRVE
jgi:hypothetical protein